MLIKDDYKSIFGIVIIIVIIAGISFWLGGRAGRPLNNEGIIKQDDEYISNRETVDPYALLEEAQRQINAKETYEAGRDKWLSENPPVKVLFDTERRTDTEYVIEYLRENPIAGDCALVWRQDVVCTDMRAGVVFPTER